MMNKVLKIVSYILFAASIVLAVLFLVNANIPANGTMEEIEAAEAARGAYLNTLLGWTYVLFGVSAVAALIMPIFNIAGNPKALKRLLVTIVLAACICVIAYALASSDPIQISGGVSTEAQAHMTETLLYITYFLAAAAVIAVIAGSIIAAIRKR